MVLALRFVAYTEVPLAEIVRLIGPAPVAIVGVANAVKAPVPVLRLYIEIVLEFIFSV